MTGNSVEVLCLQTIQTGQVFTDRSLKYNLHDAHSLEAVETLKIVNRQNRG